MDLKIKATYDQAFEIVYDKKGRIVWQRDGKGDYITDEKGARVPLRELRNNVSGTDLKRIYDIIKTELGEPSTITNSRLSDSEGGKLDLPPITGITVKIVKNEHAKNKK